MGGNTAFLKGPAEEIRHIMLNTHGGKDNGKFLVRVIAQRSLLHNLGSQLIMGQTVSGENRKLLSPDQSHQSVNRRDTGPDIVSGIFPRNRV